MTRAVIDRGIACCTVLCLVLTACGGGGGAPLPEGPTTFAYAVSECRQEKGGAFLTRQVLYVRHGDGEPRPVMEFGEVRPEPNNLVCSLAFGLPRLGFGSTALWPLQRLGVSRDGSLVVFEVTDDFSLFSQSQVAPAQKGIYVVHADGSGRRRLGPASRAPCFTQFFFPNCVFWSSPNGRTFTFTDLDSALPQLDAPQQVFTLDVGTGKPFQVTHLPTATPPTGQFPFALSAPSFVNAETIIFYSYRTLPPRIIRTAPTPTAFSPPSQCRLTARASNQFPSSLSRAAASSQTSRSPAPNSSP